LIIEDVFIGLAIVKIARLFFSSEWSDGFLLEGSASKLAVIEVGIEAAFSKKLLVGALFYDAAMIHDEDQLCVPNRREPVGNDEAGPPFH
jgi:hypothetical protein